MAKKTPQYLQMVASGVPKQFFSDSKVLKMLSRDTLVEQLRIPLMNKFVQVAQVMQKPSGSLLILS